MQEGHRLAEELILVNKPHHSIELDHAADDNLEPGSDFVPPQLLLVREHLAFVSIVVEQFDLVRHCLIELAEVGRNAGELFGVVLRDGKRPLLGFLRAFRFIINDHFCNVLLAHCVTLDLCRIKASRSNGLDDRRPPHGVLHFSYALDLLHVLRDILVPQRFVDRLGLPGNDAPAHIGACGGLFSANSLLIVPERLLGCHSDHLVPVSGLDRRNVAHIIVASIPDVFERVQPQ